ncbi:MAG TPA: hypothetical protein VF594_01805 [Rubricoccaceae bacterium]|jgi:transcriptional antiterminator Rof (Rho-off)
MSDYVPVDCGFYDRIEDAVLRRQPVALVLDGERAVTARLLDVGARVGADWVDVDGLGPVRLDAILELDGVQRPGSAACSIPER